MRVKIRHTAFGNPPLVFEYGIEGSPGPKNWTRLPYSALDPDFMVTPGMASQGGIYLRLRDTLTGAEYSSDRLMVRDFVNPEFGLSPMPTGKRYLAGAEVTLVPSSLHGPVAFDLSTNGGMNWNPLIPLGGAPIWHVNITEPSLACRLRMRADDSSFPVTIESGDFEIDTTLIQFHVTWPGNGSVLRAGDYILPKFISGIGDSVTFDLSTDNGGTWVSSFRNPPADGERSTLFILGGPSTQCRIRMRSNDGKVAQLSAVFTIEDNLADFFPIEVGSRWVYRHWIWRPGFDQFTFQIVAVTGRSQTSDIITYTCHVKDSVEGSITHEYDAIFMEKTTGLHNIICKFDSPIGMIPARYFHPDFDVITMNLYSWGRDYRATTIQKGLGFLEYYQKHYIQLPAVYEGEQWVLVR